MSVNDIMNYVNKTPGNTNPSVIKSMVENEKSKAVYASVEELKKSGGVGHTEKAYGKLTYDGNDDGKFVIGEPGTEQLVKVSDTPIDANGIKRATFCVPEDADGFPKEYPSPGVTMIVETVGADEFGANGTIVVIEYELGGLPVCFVVPNGTDDFPTGTYFCQLGGGVVYTASIEYETETIHPIDPKYIPALDSLTLNGADGKQYKLAVDESGALAATAIE
jgi:hypothetical protein